MREPKIPFATSLPVQLARRLEQEQRTSGLSASELMRRALEMYLDVADDAAQEQPRVMAAGA